MKIWPLLKSIVIIYLLLVIALFFFQRQLIYQPSAYYAHTFNTAAFDSQDYQAEALLTNPSQDRTILYFGGNAENVIATAADFKTHFPQHNTYLMKYRGYAGAAGKPSEADLYQDALALFDLISQKPHTHITVIGRSLGTGIATYLATQRPIHQLVLVTPFDSISAVAQELLPFIPIKWLLRDTFNSKSRAHKINSPTLVIVADKDGVIGQERTDALLASMPKDHLKVVRFDAGHNDLDLHLTYFKTINTFLAN